MEDLDKKLEKILAGVGVDVGEHWAVPESKDIEAIKQAFADAGWLDTNQLGGLRSTTIMTPDGFKEFMVGREWYDRFQNESRGWVDSAYSGDVDSMMEAARKASGIDE